MNAFYCPYYIKFCYLTTHIHKLLKYEIFTNHQSVSIPSYSLTTFQPKLGFVHKICDAGDSYYNLSVTNLGDLVRNKKAILRKRDTTYHKMRTMCFHNLIDDNNTSLLEHNLSDFTCFPYDTRIRFWKFADG